MKDAALQYLGMGLKPIPLCWPDQHGQCACPKRHKNEKEIGKAPLLDGGYQDVKVTEEKVEQWWTRWPQANIGILLEPSNLLVVDMDGEEAIKRRITTPPPCPYLS